MNEPKYTILPEGVTGEPLFTPEEYEKFRQWWQEEVVPKLKENEAMHRPQFQNQP